MFNLFKTFTKVNIYFGNRITPILFLISINGYSQDAGIRIYGVNLVINENTKFYISEVDLAQGGNFINSGALLVTGDWINFSTPEEIICVGDSGTVIRSTDGGKTWTTITSCASENLQRASRASAPVKEAAQLSYSVGDQGTLSKTIDKGKTWVCINTGTTSDLKAVSLIDEQTAVLVGESATIIKTEDGGNTFAAKPSPVPTTLNDVKFIDAQTGFIVCHGGRVLRTDDRGETWVVQSTSATSSLKAIEFSREATIGYAVGDSGTILKTTDGGEIFELKQAVTTETLRDVEIFNEMEALVVGDAGTILKTTDGGETWTLQASTTTSKLNAVKIISEKEAIVTGENGTVLRTADRGETFQQEQSGTTRELFSIDARRTSIVKGTVEFIGNDQTVKGNTITVFEKLTLKGGGIKSAETDVVVNGALDLTDRRLDINNNKLVVANTNKNALVYSEGFINTTSGGTLIRYTQFVDNYAFPVAIICDKKMLDIKTVLVGVTPGIDDFQVFEIGMRNFEGVVASYEQRRIFGKQETVKLNMEFEKKQTDIQFKINNQGTISDVEFKSKFNNAFLPLNPALYKITNGMQLSLNSLCSGDYYPPRPPCTSHDNVNSMHVITYDEAGSIIAESKIFKDLLGRTVQTQVKNLTEGVDIGAEVIFDAQGRSAIQTLPAPIGITLDYNNCFVTNTSDNKYNFLDFDINSTLNNPNAVNNTSQYSLGYHYSNNGDEDYVPVSSFPYVRAEVTADPIGTGKRVAASGDEFRMGTGHETRSFQMMSAGELKYVFGTNKSYKVSVDPVNRIINNPVTIAGDIVANKTISIDAEGRELITYTAGGLPIARCFSGLISACNPQDVKSKVLYRGTRSIDIHLPAAHKADLKLPLPVFHRVDIFIDKGGPVQVIVPVEVPSDNIIYKITDLNTNMVLIEGVHYTIGSDRYVIFYGNYATGSDVFRISADFTEVFKSMILIEGYFLPETIDIEYKLDYSDWSINYYDLAGNLRKSVSPKGVDCNTPGVQSMHSAYDYNPLGQLIAQVTPDVGKTELLYDIEGKPRFSQNAEQSANDEFSYINYDKHGRVVETGKYTTTSGGLYFQNFYEDAVSTPGSISVHTILNDLDGVDNANCSERNFTIYDQLDVVDEIPSVYSFKSNYRQRYLPAGVAKTFNDETATWYSYDQFGNLTFMVQRFLDDDFITQNPNVDGQVKTIDYTYNSLTGVLLKTEYQKNVNTEKFAHTFQYDSDLRLRGSVAEDATGVAGGASYEYYLTGGLKRTELGGDVQGIDYVYTINGQLKSINHPSLDVNNDPGKDAAAGSPHAGFNPDVFGLTLDYHKNDYFRSGSNIISSAKNTDPGFYNGLVYATRYKTTNNYGTNADHIITTGEQIINNTTDQLMNRFTYDRLNRLSTGVFNIYHNTDPNPELNTFTARDDFKEFGNSTAGGIDYDPNGNIISLKRNGYDVGGSDYSMDYLAYDYSSNNNMLAGITDNATITNGTYLTDFDASTLQNFTYNTIGQLKSSQAEDVADIDYFANGKVKKVTFDNGNTAGYFYNDRGLKVRTKFTDISSGNTKTTWYATGAGGGIMAVYEQETVVDNSINLTQQPVYCAGRVGVFDKATSLTTYEITDHLGNVRVTVQKNGGGLSVTSWADYYPFGSAMPGRMFNAGVYRFNYQGQENAVESNWNNFQLRMYNSSLGRFLSIDPAGQFFSPYLAMGNNPVSQVDPTGGSCPDCGAISAGVLAAIAWAIERQRLWMELLGAITGGAGGGGGRDGGGGGGVGGFFQSSLLNAVSLGWDLGLRGSDLQQFSMELATGKAFDVAEAYANVTGETSSFFGNFASGFEASGNIRIPGNDIITAYNAAGIKKEGRGGYWRDNALNPKGVTDQFGFRPTDIGVSTTWVPYQLNPAQGGGAQQDIVRHLGIVAGSTTFGLVTDDYKFVPYGKTLISPTYTVSYDAYLIVDPRNNPDRMVLYNNLGKKVAEITPFSSLQSYRFDLSPHMNNLPNNQFSLQVTPMVPFSVFSIDIYGSWGWKGTRLPQEPLFR